MAVEIEVFTSPRCPHCPHAKDLAKRIAKEKKAIFRETSTATSHGSNRAQRFGVRSVPTIFVKGPKFDRIGFRGQPPEKSLRDAVDISLGLKEYEPPKGLMESIKDGIKNKLKSFKKKDDTQ